MPDTSPARWPVLRRTTGSPAAGRTMQGHVVGRPGRQKLSPASLLYSKSLPCPHSQLPPSKDEFFDMVAHLSPTPLRFPPAIWAAPAGGSPGYSHRTSCFSVLMVADFYFQNCFFYLFLGCRLIALLFVVV
ncbi:hypothetical protein VPH35_095545 [Triticum aestivum]